MQDGHDNLEGTLVEFLMFVDRNTTTVILNRNGVVFVDGHLDVLAIACHCLVDGVVDGLVNQVVESFFADVANVHGRTFPYCFQPFEDLDVTGGVIILVFLIFCHFR